jgi:hypothetical protein
MTDYLRVSDAERHDVGELLSRHFADGRLDRDELDQRIGQAMQARTRGDLAAVLVDLPSLAPAPAPPRAPGWGRRLAALALAVPLLALPLALFARTSAARTVGTRIPAILIPARVLVLPPPLGGPARAPAGNFPILTRPTVSP